MNRRLIVTADDFGLTEKVNEGILLAHRSGIVTSASLMVNGRAFESATAMARRNPGLDVGLHLNLTEGRPVTDPSRIPSLANTHGFIYHHPIDLWVALWRRKANVADVDTEMRAQLVKALDAGVEITHIDGHKHVHAMRPVLDAVLRAASASGVKAVRSTVERVPGLPSLLQKNRPAAIQVSKQYLSSRVLSLAFRMSMRKGVAYGLVTPSRFYGLTQTGFLDLEAVAGILRDLPCGVSEMMCHPGYVDVDLEKTPTRLRLQRERELELLTGCGVRKLIDEENVQLASYKDLVRDYGSSDAHTLFHRRSAV